MAESYDSCIKPGAIPFEWEIRPGVPNRHYQIKHKSKQPPSVSRPLPKQPPAVSPRVEPEQTQSPHRSYPPQYQDRPKQPPPLPPKSLPEYTEEPMKSRKLRWSSPPKTLAQHLSPPPYQRSVSFWSTSNDQFDHPVPVSDQPSPTRLARSSPRVFLTPTLTRLKNLRLVHKPRSESGSGSETPPRTLKLPRWSKIKLPPLPLSIRRRSTRDSTEKAKPPVEFTPSGRATLSFRSTPGSRLDHWLSDRCEWFPSSSHTVMKSRLEIQKPEPKSESVSGPESESESETESEDNSDVEESSRRSHSTCYETPRTSFSPNQSPSH